MYILDGCIEYENRESSGVQINLTSTVSCVSDFQEEADYMTHNLPFPFFHSSIFLSLFFFFFEIHHENMPI